jgi:hypothetical protein
MTRRIGTVAVISPAHQKPYDAAAITIVLREVLIARDFTTRSHNVALAL